MMMIVMIRSINFRSLAHDTIEHCRNGFEARVSLFVSMIQQQSANIQ